MSQNYAKQLESYILKSTSENMTHPDSQMFVEICNIINSRADMPKQAMLIIRKRIMSKHPKTVYLCLELLEVAANACEISFHTQIASKDFMLVISSLVSKDIDKTVFEKLCHLVKYWVQIFEPYRDILPTFFEFYNALQKKGVEFPSYVESKYAYLLKNKPKPQKQSHTESYEGSYAESTGRSNQGTFYSSQQQSTSKGMPPKLKKDLELVRQNVNLTNEMIDAHDIREDVRKNDVLTDLMQTLKAMEHKLRDFIEKQTEEETLNFLLQLNDDINLTFERYKDIRKGQKPRPYIPAGIDYSKTASMDPSSYKPRKMGPSQHDDLLDLLGPSENKGQSNQSNPAMKKPTIIDLFDSDLIGPTTTNTSNTGGNQQSGSLFDNDLLSGANNTNTQKPQSNTDSSFGGFGGFGGFNTQQPSTNTSKPTENIMDKLKDLYNNPNAGSQLESGGGMSSFNTVATMGGSTGNTFGGSNMGGFGGNMSMGGMNNFNTSMGIGGFGANNPSGGFGGNNNMGGFGTNPTNMSGNFGGNPSNMGGFGGNMGMGFNTVSGNPSYGTNMGFSGGMNTGGNFGMGMSSFNTTSGYGGYSGGSNMNQFGNPSGFSNQGTSFATTSNLGMGTQNKSSNPFDLTDLGENIKDQKKDQQQNLESKFDNLLI